METIYSSKDILEILPHRHPFILVDRIVECNDVESGRATDTDTTPREAAATPIRVAVVDDHEMFRAGVIATLQPYFHIVGQAADVEGSIAMIADIRPDVVLLVVEDDEEVLLAVEVAFSVTVKVIASLIGCPSPETTRQRTSYPPTGMSGSTAMVTTGPSTCASPTAQFVPSPSITRTTAPSPRMSAVNSSRTSGGGDASRSSGAGELDSNCS